MSIILKNTMSRILKLDISIKNLLSFSNFYENHQHSHATSNSLKHSYTYITYIVQWEEGETSSWNVKNLGVYSHCLT